MVESRCGAVALGRTYLLPPLSSGGALVVQPWLRFHIPLIEPDRQISRIRLSDKTSRLHPRHVVPKPAQAYEPIVGDGRAEGGRGIFSQLGLSGERRRDGKGRAWCIRTDPAQFLIRLRPALRERAKILEASSRQME